MGFDYASQWAEFHDALLSGDPLKVNAAVALLHERDRLLEDYLNGLTYTLPVHLVTPTTGLVSDRFYPPQSAYLVKVLASLTTAGSTTTTIDVKRNGSAITPAATINLASSAHTGFITTHQLFDASAADYSTVTCTTAGTSAAGLVVLLVFRPIT